MSGRGGTIKRFVSASNTESSIRSFHLLRPRKWNYRRTFEPSFKRIRFLKRFHRAFALPRWITKRITKRDFHVDERELLEDIVRNRDSNTMYKISEKNIRTTLNVRIKNCVILRIPPPPPRPPFPENVGNGS